MLYKFLLALLLIGVVPWSAAGISGPISINHIHHDIELEKENYYVKSTFQIAISNLPKEQKIPLVTSTAVDDIKSLAVYYNGKKVTIDKPVRKASFVLPTLEESFTLIWLNIDGRAEEDSQLTVRYQLRRTESDMEFLAHKNFLMVANLVPATDSTTNIGYEVKQRAHFDFGNNPIMHSATLHHPPNIGVIASANPEPIDGGHKVPDISAANFLVGFYKNSTWNTRELLVAGTPFTVMTRTQGSEIGLAELTGAVELIWPQYVEKFYSISRHVYFIDFESPLGGSSPGNNILYVAYSENISDELQSYFYHNLNFKNKSSNTMGYIEQAYPESSRPVRNYILDMVAHELGHLYFGYGETYENTTARHDRWLSLGLGLVYDQEFYRKVAGQQPQLVDMLTKRWRNHFSKIEDLDQKLVNPDTGNDAKYNLDRLQAYSHGKAAVVLRELRQRIGVEKFDQVVLKYLKGDLGNNGYASFRSGIEEVYPGIVSFEAEWSVR